MIYPSWGPSPRPLTTYTSDTLAADRITSSYRCNICCHIRAIVSRDMMFTLLLCQKKKRQRTLDDNIIIMVGEK